MNDDAREILDRYLEAREPGPARAAAAWAAVDGRLADGDQGPVLIDEPARATTKLVIKGAVVGVLAAGLAVVGWQLGRGGTTPEPAPATVPIERVEPPAPPPPPAVAVADAPTRIENAPPPAAPRALEDGAATQAQRPKDLPRPRPSPRSPTSDRELPPDAPAPASTLAEEMRLLSKGQQALRAGDAAAALAQFDTHARRFPDGALRDERRVKRAQALCALGRVEDARREAQAFVAQTPGSPLAGKAARICREGEP